MAEPAKNVAQQTEDRLEDLAETVREKFDRVTKGTYRDRLAGGRFAEPGEKSRPEAERKQD
ncbi:hypothetical protein [Micromonospora sp. WMMD1155]|uniref:hypothetical protein n=1 Tax=Micromonospora sp. WMMD1155 TaxID=3016094 RepID=UPI00249BCD36|nr:hypothetical protein [Micromonospora sp. WMMD1155]WFE50892.1 hypothetical protein O7617_11395 [Micromonospora sp. WMMD1155]